MSQLEGKNKILRSSLKANGIFSGISGLMFLVGHSYLAMAIGLSNPIILMIIGLSLMVFSWGLFQLASKQEMNKHAVWTIIGSDLAWVIASAVLLLMYPNLLNETGSLLVIIIGLIIFTLVELQAWGQWQSIKGSNNAKKIFVK